MDGNCFGGELLFSLSSPPPSTLLFLPASLPLSFLLAASVDLMSVPNVNTHRIYYLADMTHCNFVKSTETKSQLLVLFFFIYYCCQNVTWLNVAVVFLFILYLFCFQKGIINDKDINVTFVLTSLAFSDLTRCVCVCFVFFYSV